MKTPTTLLNFLLGATLCGASAFAQDAAPETPRDEGRPPARERRSESRNLPGFLNRLDADHDGALSKEELDQAGRTLRALDENGDGKIAADEFPGRRGAGPAGQGPRDGSGPGARARSDRADGPSGPGEAPDRPDQVERRRRAAGDGERAERPAEGVRRMDRGQDRDRADVDGPRRGPNGRGPGPGAGPAMRRHPGGNREAMPAEGGVRERVRVEERRAFRGGDHAGAPRGPQGREFARGPQHAFGPGLPPGREMRDGGRARAGRSDAPVCPHCGARRDGKGGPGHRRGPNGPGRNG